MRTDEFVAMLARSNVDIAPRSVERRFALGIGFGVVASSFLFVGSLDIRADLTAAAAVPMFWVKLGFAASLMLASLVAALRLSRPGVPIGRAPVAIATPIAALWLLAIATLMTTPPSQRLALLLGDSWAVCPWLIAMLAVPVFVGSMWAMAGLAPTRLSLAGATAGLLSGATATLIYCVHCPEMAAPFLATWYVLGIAIPTIVGALLGPRLLHW